MPQSEPSRRELQEAVDAGGLSYAHFKYQLPYYRIQERLAERAQTTLPPVLIRPASEDELARLHTLLRFDFPRGASVTLLASRAGYGKGRTEEILRWMQRNHQLSCDIGRWRLL
jgi:hypothetical protein